MNKTFAIFQKGRIRRQEINFDRFIEEIKGILIILPGIEKAQVLFKVNARVKSLFIDINLFKEVFINLIMNSIEAMTGRGKIEIEMTDDSNSFHLKIKDNGKGMSETELQKIFTPFYTTSSDKGLGLGIPIVKRIVELHEGKVQCKSTPNQGTEFTITLSLKSMTL